MIDSIFKDKMLVETQRLCLAFFKEGNYVVVRNFHEIGKAWKMMSFDLLRVGIVN